MLSVEINEESAAGWAGCSRHRDRVGIRTTPSSAPEKLKWVNLDHRCDPLHGTQREVSLPPLYATHVGAVHADEVGEVFLAEAPRRAVSAQVAADGPLQVPFHLGIDAASVLLVSLQTYE